MNCSTGVYAIEAFFILDFQARAVNEYLQFKTKKLCKKTLQSFIGIIYSSAQFVLSPLVVRTQLMTHYHIGYFVLSEISINHFFLNFILCASIFGVYM